MSDQTTALRLSGRDVLPLLHRTTSNALADLVPGMARATLFCDFRGRLLHRAVVAMASDAAVWLLRDDAPGAELAAAVDRMVFRDDVRIEDRSAEFTVRRDLVESAPQATFRTLDSGVHAPLTAATGDGTTYTTEPGEALADEARIEALIPGHGHEVAEAFNPYEVGLAAEVHLAKGCFTGQEALQRLITYDSVRRRPVHVRLPGLRRAVATGEPLDVFAAGERAGLLTRIAGLNGFAILRRDALANAAPFALEDGSVLEIVSAPELARPLGRP
ncbi:MAG: hypothetical protein ABL977_06330 [Candidatus Eisenbacteria bacterium]